MWTSMSSSRLSQREGDYLIEGAYAYGVGLVLSILTMANGLPTQDH